MLESEFQPELKRELKRRFPGCVIIKQDPNTIQGIPDLLVLWGPHWALLETKRGFKEKTQPNQPYYVQLCNEMSFSAFVRPQNYLEILDEMERLWK
jgi:hypothetical protein